MNRSIENAQYSHLTPSARTRKAPILLLYRQQWSQYSLFSSVFVNPINVHFIIIKATILLKNLKRLVSKPKTCWPVFTYSKPFLPQQTRICWLFFPTMASNSTTCQLTSNIEQLTSRKGTLVRPIIRNMCQFDLYKC